MKGFKKVDEDRSGFIDMKELFTIIAKNVRRQGLLKEDKDD
jgi:Ca2+-binding EF-hand superfamily protein